VKVIPPEGTSIKDAHPLWLSKVLGMFPDNAQDMGLIPVTWIEAAQERNLEPGEPNELGVDVGGGGDTSTTAQRRGPVVRVISEDQNPDTMQTCGKVIEERRRTGAARVKVDRIGIGAGVTDRGREQGEPFVGVNVGESPICICDGLRRSNPSKYARLLSGEHYQDCNVSRFVNLRAQFWWEVRERFENGTIDIDAGDRRLAAELASIKFKRTSQGKIQIESKEEAKRRGFPSPNRGDSVMLAYCSPPEQAQPLKGGLAW
jgi:hypothetical protein